MSLKLGSETASLSNHLLSRGVRGEPVPEVGMGATLLAWTDRHPATIVEVVRKADGALVRIGVCEDDAKRVDSNGMSEDQSYVFTPRSDGYVAWYAKDRKGFWVRVEKNEASGRWVQRRGNGLRIGERDKYHDFSF